MDIESTYEQNVIARLLEDAYKAIESTNTWEFVAKDPGFGGFMYNSAPELCAISKAMKYYTIKRRREFAITIRTIQHIHRIGWDAYVAEYLKAVGKA